MPEVQLRTRAGGSTTLDGRALQALEQGLAGRLLRPGSPMYDEARTVWNGMIDRKPGLIVRCGSAEDAARAVRLAAEHDLLLSVRGGGHNIAGNAVCDGGLMVDLSQMAAVRVDVEARTARVEGGATLGDFDRAAQAYGLATPLGINSTTGVAGLTLGGGFGWLSRSLGLTIDNLLAADVVTASGDMVRASAEENPDLFWGLRGGGGNFGLVTSFEYRLHPIGPDVFAGLLVYPIAEAREVLRFYRDYIAGTNDKLNCWFVLRQAPPAPFVPEEWHFKEILALAVCYAGDMAEGEREAAPLRAFRKPLLDMLGPHPYAAWQTALDPLLTPGMRNYWKSHDFLELSDGLIDTLVGFAERLPDPQTELACARIGGAVSRVAPAATAYAHRQPPYALNVHGRWADPAKDETCIQWARDVFQATAPFATGGVYVNFMTQEEQGRVRAAYGPNYDRLAALKARWDPMNLFRLNQNIQPAAQEQSRAA